MILQFTNGYLLRPGTSYKNYTSVIKTSTCVCVDLCVCVCVGGGGGGVGTHERSFGTNNCCMIVET